ncbi:MAG: VWA domain-containing protein [Nitrospirae bacterium]|nr:VWA domain-containing protein [Nitrospirota bacterium]
MFKELFGLLTKEQVQMPLFGVDVYADISGRGARVRIVQEFINKEEKPVEAVYKFPLPENSAVCRFRIKAGDKVIESDVEEKNKAFELYDEALIEGHGAYLLDEERPNIFTLSVGNLNPSTSASIEIEYISLLVTNDSEVRFCLPTTISPRYIPDGLHTDGIPEDDRINPVFAPDVPYGMRVVVNIHDKGNISSIESPSHTISTKIDGNPVRIEFSSETEKMDKDFIINIRYKNDFKNRGYVYSVKGNNFIQIDFSPVSDNSGDMKDIAPAAREVIFVLDCSGSMEGSSISEAKKAIEIFIKGLNDSVRFNIYRFGSTFEKLFDRSKPYTDANIKAALAYISKIDADLGGTEVLSPLKDIYLNDADSASKNIILITDGQIGNESEIIELARKGGDKNRLFTVGIGHGPNEYFLSQTARISNGVSELIAPGERIEPKILRLFKKVMSGNLRDLKIQWGNNIEQSPAMPIVYYGDTASIFGRIKEGTDAPDKIKITAMPDNLLREWIIDLQEIHSDSAPVHMLWAREMIRDLEEGVSEIIVHASKQTGRKDGLVKDKIIKLSKEFGILSRETSFIGIEIRAEHEKTKGGSVLRKISVMLTRGWGEMAMKYDNYARHSMDMSDNDMSEVDCYKVDLVEYNERCMEFATEPLPKKLFNKDAVLVMLLSVQKTEGGFIIDDDIAVIINTTIKDLKSITKSIKVKGKPDKFKLLSTAIVLAFLMKEFTDEKDMWEEVVKKSELWLQNEIQRTQPTIDGMPMEEWVERYVEKINISIEE